MEKNKGRQGIGFSILLLLGLFGIGLLVLPNDFVLAEPSGGDVTPGTPETAPADTPGNDSAQAGNVTGLTLTGFSTTQAWQGYFGNVSGTIQLADASDNVLYNWSQASPGGEVYASTNTSISWSDTLCFNFTAEGNYSTGGESAGGGTSLYGTNITQLETEFGISETDVDGVNETFTSPGTGHNEFFTANLNFTVGECPSAAIFDSTGASVDGNFEEALLYEPTTASVIFASLLEDSTDGFDGDAHDFEMLVLEDGHGNTASTLYHFYIELDG